MTTRFLLSHGARLACASAISEVLVVRAVFNLRGFTCAMERCAGVIVVYKSAAPQFSSIRWSAAG
jgi:hypothetical protein